jgi:ribonuclease HII
VTRYSLDELRQRYVIEGRPLEASLEEILRADTRAGARAIFASIEKRRFENRSEGQRLRKMLRFETLLWDEGQDAVAGVDEAGMSPLAGPVSAAAVILKPGTRITGIDDSKKLDATSREALAKEIKEKAASWSVAFVEVEEIDTINIYWAGILAMRRAVESLRVVPQHLLIDAKRLKEIAIPQQAIIKGDAKSASIAAASILAKVSRDALMRALDTRHPGYGTSAACPLSGPSPLMPVERCARDLQAKLQHYHRMEPSNRPWGTMSRPRRLSGRSASPTA